MERTILIVWHILTSQIFYVAIATSSLRCLCSPYVFIRLSVLRNSIDRYQKQINANDN